MNLCVCADKLQMPGPGSFDPTGNTSVFPTPKKALFSLSTPATQAKKVTTYSSSYWNWRHIVQS